MNLLWRQLRVLGKVPGGVILFLMLLYAIQKYPQEGLWLYFALLISILMILSGWILPPSPRRKDEGDRSNSGGHIQ